MSDKLLSLFENNNNKDACTIRKTAVTMTNHETGEVLFKCKPNKVIVAGSAFTAGKHFHIPALALTPSYNSIMGLDNTASKVGNHILEEELVFLFAVGTDGCGVENSQVYDVDYTKWIDPASLVPFRYQLDTNDLSGSQREKYFGAKTAGGRIAYYFKAFEIEPVFKQQYIDGTPIDESIYIATRTDEVESFVELSLKVTKDDCRDYFLATTGIDDARINSLSLLTAWAKTINGFTYYQDIRPLTKINFPNESLIDLTKGLDIIYHIYY